MQKQDIINQIADDIALNAGEVRQVVDSFIKIMAKNVAAGEEIYLRGFASFILKDVKEKKGQNLQKGGTILIPAHKKAVVKYCKEITDAVKKLPVK